MTTGRPVPVPDDMSAPFWAAAARHVLTVARCGRCATFTLPPDVVCPHCGSTDPEFSFEPIGGHATVQSWTVVRQSFLPGFEDDLPFVLVDAQLDEHPDLRMIGRLLDGMAIDLHIGSPVRVGFEDIAPGVAIPAFRLAQ